MDLFSQNKIVLSLAILAVGTAAVFWPGFLIGGIVIFGTIFLAWQSPTFGIGLTLAAAFLSEFGRVELDGFSFLMLDLVAPIILGIWLFQKFWQKEKIEFDRAAVWLLIFWLIAITSLAVGNLELSSAEFQFAFLRLLRFITISGLFLVARDLPKKAAEKSLRILFLEGTIFALAGFVLLQLIPDFQEAGLADIGWDPHIGRLTSTFLDPNFAAGAFAFLLALLGGKFLRTKILRTQVWFSILGGIFGVALLLTFSRSGLLALGISGLVLGTWANRKILLAMIIVGVLAISASPRLAERVSELGQSVSSFGETSLQVLDPTAQLRVESWQEGWRIFAENPILGSGFGTYKFEQNFADSDSHAATGSDASLLNLAATTGILGFLAFVVFLVNLFWVNLQAKNWGFLAALVGLLVHSIFVNSLFFAPLETLFFISAGLANRGKI